MKRTYKQIEGRQAMINRYLTQIKSPVWIGLQSQSNPAIVTVTVGTPEQIAKETCIRELFNGKPADVLKALTAIHVTIQNVVPFEYFEGR